MSYSMLVGLCTIAGSLVFDLNLGLPGAQAATTTGTSLSSTTSLNDSFVAATAVSRSWDCACGPSCALFVDQHCAGQSGAGGRWAFPGFWLVAAAFLVRWFVLVSGNAASSLNSPQNDDAKTSFSTVTKAPSTVNEESSSTITYRPIAGRLFPEKVATKRSEPEAKQAIQETTTNIPTTYPGATRLAILLALLILSAMLVPMALAEPTSTSMPSTSLTLPLSSPCTTAFNVNATGTAVNVALHEKDKPQTWFYNPPSSSERRSVHPLLDLIPMLMMMALLFSLPSFAAGNSEKNANARIVEDTSVSPVWQIFYSTTTVWPPTSTVTAPRDVSSSEPTEKPISVAGNGGGCGPAAGAEICTEANPAVCPIVLGRKPWRPV